MSNQAHTPQPVIKILDLPARLAEFEDLLVQFAYARMPLDELQEHVKKQYFMAVVKQENLNYCAAARVLGVHRNTVERTLGRKWVLKHEVSTNRGAVQPPDPADGPSAERD